MDHPAGFSAVQNLSSDPVAMADERVARIKANPGRAIDRELNGRAR